MISKKQTKEIIRSTLGLDSLRDKAIDESYVAQPKQYDHNTELISQKAKMLHREVYENHIKALNKISAQLDTADRTDAYSTASQYRSLKIDEVYNRNAVWLHELHFANISDQHSEISLDSLSYIMLERDFGTFDAWQIDFMAAAKSARSGWVMCAYDMFLKKHCNYFIDANDIHVPIGVYPVIVLDVADHSYVKDYLGHLDDYIVGQMKELQWEIIEERVKRAQEISRVLK